MPKIEESKERILIHVSDLWKRKNITGWNFRWHDVGKKGGKNGEKRIWKERRK